MNFEKEQDRLTSLTIIEKRYSFLFEDVWFILLQYMYFEKFVIYNSEYLAQDEENLEIKYEELDKSYGLMIFNVLFTALIGLLGLTTIPYCLKMIKQEKIKTSIFYIMTFIQIILQTTFPFMRAVMVIIQVTNTFYPFNDVMRYCTLVGFRV